MAAPAKVEIVYNHLPQLRGRARERAHTAVWQTAQLIAHDWKDSMTGDKHGRTYRIGDVTRRLTKGERRGVTVGLELGRLVMRTSEGLRVTASASGKTFYAVVGAKLHRASAPGEAPAIRTGAYFGAVKARMVSYLSAEVTPGSLAYPAILEYGGVHVAPRPAAVPAARKNAPLFVQAMQNLFE